LQTLNHTRTERPKKPEIFLIVDQKKIHFRFPGQESQDHTRLLKSCTQVCKHDFDILKKNKRKTQQMVRCVYWKILTHERRMRSLHKLY
jgi:hypothetical protein